MIIVQLSNIFLYIAFAFVSGYYILKLIPEQYQPTISLKKQSVESMLISIPILLAVPTMNVITTLTSQFGSTWPDAISSVLFTYATGQALLFASIITVSMLLIQRAEKQASQLTNYLLLIGTVLLMLSASWASHGASIAGWMGFISTFIHFLSVAAWIGPLFVMGWFASQLPDSQKLHKWFSPVAAGAVLLLSLSGLFLVTRVTQDYFNGWLLSYGQFLLVKHLLYLPLLFFGFRHLVLLSLKKPRLSGAQLQRSFKAESIIAFFIFLVTGFMSELEPPHEVLRTLQSEPVSWVTQWFIQEPLSQYQLLSFSPGPIGFVLLYLAIIFLLAGLAIMLLTRGAFFSSLMMALLFISLYGGLMTSLSPGEIYVDNTSYSEVEDAIAASHPEQSTIDVLWEDINTDDAYAIYTVNETDLGLEKLTVNLEKFTRIPVSGLVLEGGFSRSGTNGTQTQRFDSGSWYNPDFRFTYVTFGYTPLPEAERARIAYSGETITVPIEDQTFLSITDSDENWYDSHTIEILDGEDTVLDSFELDSMSGGFHH
ncbi:copper resistance D family protein [Alkalicoccobacillus murimartini]|uniref:Copper resistance protein D n=1 Tax=Alkalicoccobacillus murimartini TaxID=171685 RepID=A0ABT9YHX1_9BACI|nr:copper resistance D family protein [Alkalicoccobacillus murimartini]MDQ0207460.1 putative copper resistance protein D [Alkalicoccobacillus murimartini]